MTHTPDFDDAGPPFATRLRRVVVSIVVLEPITVFLGYGGWIVLSITATRFGYEPESTDCDPVRLVAWPDRNREVMRTDGRAPLPFRSKTRRITHP